LAWHRANIHAVVPQIPLSALIRRLAACLPRTHAEDAIMQDEIKDLEARRYAAMKAGDVAALRVLLSPRLVYSHSDATQDSRETYLHSIGSGSLRYHDIRYETMTVLEAGADTAVALGTMGADIVRNGTDKTIAAMTCAVWSLEPDGWRLLAYQPTALAPK
jgi:ketosteroid isomerase-like protein